MGKTDGHWSHARRQEQRPAGSLRRQTLERRSRIRRAAVLPWERGRLARFVGAQRGSGGRAGRAPRRLSRQDVTGVLAAAVEGGRVWIGVLVEPFGGRALPAGDPLEEWRLHLVADLLLRYPAPAGGVPVAAVWTTVGR